jgi:hypothetical protein
VRQASAKPASGVVSTPVVVEQRRYTFWGLPVLGAVLVLSAAARLAHLLPGTVRWPVLAAVAVVVLGAVVGPAFLRRRVPGQPGRVVPVRRFEVQRPSGETVHCVLVGEITGGEIRHGDAVRIRGRRRVDLLATPRGPLLSQIKARPPLDFHLVRWASRLCFVLAALVGAWTVVSFVSP